MYVWNGANIYTEMKCENMRSVECECGMWDIGNAIILDLRAKLKFFCDIWQESMKGRGNPISHK